MDKIQGLVHFQMLNRIHRKKKGKNKTKNDFFLNQIQSLNVIQILLKSHQKKTYQLQTRKIDSVQP